MVKQPHNHKDRSGPPRSEGAEVDRTARLEAALRANLKRRKQGRPDAKDVQDETDKDRDKRDTPERDEG